MPNFEGPKLPVKDPTFSFEHITRSNQIPHNLLKMSETPYLDIPSHHHHSSPSGAPRVINTSHLLTNKPVFSIQLGDLIFTVLYNHD